MGLAPRIRRVVSIGFVFLLMACGSDSGDNEVIELPTFPIERERDRSQEFNTDPAEDPVPPSSTEVEGHATPSPTADAANLDADGDGWLNADEFQIALINASGDYEFAPGFPMTGEQAWNSFTAGNPDQAHGAEYQTGLGDVMLGVYFECSWMLSWIEAFTNGDNQLQDEALAYLERMLEPGYFDDQASRDAVSSVLGQAQLGDPAGIQQWVNANCQNIKWAS